MKINVIKMDGLDLACEGWRLSRDLTRMPDWREVFAVDVPVNEFPSIVVNFEDATIIEREIFAAPRNHTMWARTSHVDDPLDFRVPIELDVPAFTNTMREAMKEGKAAGQSQDEWRSFLPVTSTTSWTSRINFRDLVKLAKYFEHLVETKEMVPPLWSRIVMVAENLRVLIDRFTNDRRETLKAISNYSLIKFLHEAEVEHKLLGAEPNSSFFLIRLRDIPLWLRAQIVRHRGIGFVDDFFSKVLTHQDVLKTSIGFPLNMELAVTKEFWRTIMAKRSCWIAQDTLSSARDPWQVIIDQFGWTPEMLPCADGTHCPYALDAGLRLTPADPGAPCPRYLNINNIKQEPYRDRIDQALNSRHPFWRSQVKS